MMSGLPRRAFLGATGAVMVSGCVTPAARQAASDCTPLVPVQVDPSRVIRTLSGLRPYRKSGFVVRRDRLGEAVVVHNYGHGGSGITLSWGSSKLAADLGLKGHGGPVAVIGAGVMGLTTARLVQEAGFPVTVYAGAFPPDTTSNVSGGQFHPFGHFREEAVTPEWREQFRQALDYSWRRFQIMVGEEYGIRWLPTYTESDGPEAPVIANFPPINRVLARAEHPFPVQTIVRYDTMYVETGRYLRQLMRDIRAEGGSFKVQYFASSKDIGERLSERLIFNCSALGSRYLFGDKELVPVRGQLAVLLPQPEVRYAFTGQSGYMFPRPDGIILGGTFEPNIVNETADPWTVARILERHRQFFAGFRCTA
jgi:glycine/D-amino acid oxidase-like deaminating enzyme